MINAGLLVLHVLFVIFVFIQKNKAESTGAAFNNIFLIMILFAVGWAISAMVINQIFEPAGFGKYFDRDTITLSLLTLGEVFFYRIFYKNLLTRR